MSEKYIPSFLVISSYLFGIVCIKLGYYPELVNLTWFQMLLTASVLIYVQWKNNNSGFYRFLAISYFVGFIVEVAGINTGVIFGEYTYGNVLGWKSWGTPWMIGVNWFIVTYVVNQFISQWQLNIYLHSIVAAFFITALDYIIEPTAIELGMWTWASNIIPLKNYVAWFVVSLGLSYYYHLQKLPIKYISYIVLGLMILFFVV